MLKETQESKQEVDVFVVDVDDTNEFYNEMNVAMKKGKFVFSFKNSMISETHDSE